MKLPKRAALVLILIGTPWLSAFAAQSKPVFLYSRYFNAEGEDRYSPDTAYKDVLEKLRAEFDVRVHAEPLNNTALKGANVVLISNPSDKAVAGHAAPHHFSAADIRALTRFVENGGGLIIMGNQENHNLEIEDTNKLLSHFGLRFTNLFTDAKKLIIPKETPILGGLRWAYYTGNQVAVDAHHAAKPRGLIMNDLSQPPIKGPRDAAGALLAIAEPKRGRVAVVTDAGWIANPALSGEGIGGVAIKDQDNWEIFRRLARWAAHADQ